MANVFLSYDREDVGQARTIATLLERAGHVVWWDRQIMPGTEFSKAIESALKSADAVVVLWSIRAVESAWVRDEAATGRDSGRLVPVTLDKTEPPLGFRQFQTIDLAGGRVRSASQSFQSLLAAIAAVPPHNEQSNSPAQAPGTRRLLPPSRRQLVALLVAAGALAGVGYVALRDHGNTIPPGVEPLLTQAWLAWTQGTSEGHSQAIGLYQRAIKLAPDYPDSWGFLGCLYGDMAHFAPLTEQASLRDRAREAGKRALQLDPKNAYGRMAVVYAQPLRGNWLVMEREFRQASQDQPGKALVTYSLALLLMRVGRFADAAVLFNQLRDAAPTVSQNVLHVRSLWGSGQIGQAEQMLADADAIYALNDRIWSLRYDMLLAGGQAAAAAALARDPAARPTKVTDEWLSRRAAVATAVASAPKVDIAALATQLVADGHQAAAFAERSIQDLALLGQLDEAFALANAYYFSRGSVIPDQPSTTDVAGTVSLLSRDTIFLFMPPLRAMRADSRFDRLVEQLGMARYWQDAKSQPDYRRA